MILDASSASYKSKVASGLQMLTVGIDPDSEKHGVAIYRDGKLDSLHMMTTMGLLAMASAWRSCAIPRDVLLSIENVCANNFTYSRNRQESKEAQCKISLCTGRNQQAQTELMRMLDYVNVKYVLHNPQKGNWGSMGAAGINVFKMATGWTGRSNKDTRSAAYFGFLAVNGGVG